MPPSYTHLISYLFPIGVALAAIGLLAYVIRSLILTTRDGLDEVSEGPIPDDDFAGSGYYYPLNLFDDGTHAALSTMLNEAIEAGKTDAKEGD